MVDAKKILFALFFLFSGLAVKTQEKGDLGVLFSSFDQFRTGIEYRKPMGDNYRFKLGGTYGGSGNILATSYDVFEVTDSTFSTRHYSKQSTWTGLRIGFERKMGISVFSVGADVNLGYFNLQEYYANQNWTLNEVGDWQEDGFAPFFPDNDALYAAQITRHFFSPAFRLSLNMDAPLGKAFLLNFSIASSIGTPIYMGATNVLDPLDEFIGTPGFILNWNTNVGVGLRYIIGSKEI